MTNGNLEALYGWFVGGIPFLMSAEKTYSYEDEMENIMQARRNSVKNGTSEMMLNEIIADYRRSRRARRVDVQPR